MQVCHAFDEDMTTRLRWHNHFFCGTAQPQSDTLCVRGGMYTTKLHHVNRLQSYKTLPEDGALLKGCQLMETKGMTAEMLNVKYGDVKVLECAFFKFELIKLKTKNYKTE